ncbi:unnamed protein product [Peronospora belbahrii]|uniref:Uncharacterized protein n=1 Tax=Peronospora belbahrii TaxID=622444 RepID=A0ABN8D066_9STRA|nr:unnamed protein product [Peronospora belbahrii]
MVQYEGYGVFVGMQYLSGVERSDETPLEYLYRFKVAGMRAKIPVRHGSPTARREHVEYFFKTLDDRDLEKQLRYYNRKMQMPWERKNYVRINVWCSDKVKHRWDRASFFSDLLSHPIRHRQNLPTQCDRSISNPTAVDRNQKLTDRILLRINETFASLLQQIARRVPRILDQIIVDPNKVMVTIMLDRRSRVSNVDRPRILIATGRDKNACTI